MARNLETFDGSGTGRPESGTGQVGELVRDKLILTERSVVAAAATWLSWHKALRRPASVRLAPWRANPET
jgi:hypothetical protein